MKKISFSISDPKQEGHPAPYYEFTCDQKVTFGLLRRKKTYQTRLLLEINTENLAIIPPLDEDLEITTKIISMNLYEVTLRLYTRRTGNYEESFQIVSPQLTENLVYLVTATIMGKDRGTPMLKSSVYCHSNRPKDDDSDESDEETDWSGF